MKSIEDIFRTGGIVEVPAAQKDELLMELPVAPRHVICPVLPAFSAGEAEFNAALGEKKNPFAALEALKSVKPKS